MRQNISVVRARTYNLIVRLTGPDNLPFVMQSGEQLIFGVKKIVCDTEYVIKKIIPHQHGFEQVAIVDPSPEWKENTYYSKMPVNGVDEYILTISEPESWADVYMNYYINTGIGYPIQITPSDTEGLAPARDYYYDVGLQRGSNYYSIIDTSKFSLDGNVTVKED
jgi:hypothetical protein